MSAKSRAAAVSVASNASLVAMKLAVGLLSGSVSIVSEAIHSANDLLAATIAWFSVRTSDKAADAEHPYGHGKIEGVSGAIRTTRGSETRGTMPKMQSARSDSSCSRAGRS